jgi:hypothetical protein
LLATNSYPSSLTFEKRATTPGACAFVRASAMATVIHQDTPDQYHVIENVQTPPGARDMGLDPSNHRVFIVSAKFGPAPAGGRGRRPVVPGSFTLMTIEHGLSAR